jgi:hypothetical protein
MKPTILISFLIVALLTAGSPAPELITNNIAEAQIIKTPTIQPVVTMLPILTGTSDLTITFNSGVSPGCLAPKGMRGRTAPFKIENIGTKKANVNINGTSRNGNYIIYCSLIVKKGSPVIIELMWGNYVYLVARGSKTSRGSFFINTADKATMRVFKDKVRIGPFP